MKLSRFTREQVIEARDTCGVPSLYFADGILDRSSSRTPIFRVCLRVSKLLDGRTRRGNPKYKPNPFARAHSIRAVWGGRRTNLGPYVNWDGHFKFMARLFELNPDGCIESGRYGRVVYRGEADFYFQCAVSRNVLVASKSQVITGTRDVTYGEL
jgi:hypothetical protein